MIVTFYSWKGGVGRTMALANVAVQLARLGSNVLLVDWDLEAPGLDHYFARSEAHDIGYLSIREPTDRNGLLGLLKHASDIGGAAPRPEHWRQKLIEITVRPPHADLLTSLPVTPSHLDLLPSGYGCDGYANVLAEFSWSAFFADRRGGEWLEALRKQWSDAYDFVLIDS